MLILTLVSLNTIYLKNKHQFYEISLSFSQDFDELQENCLNRGISHIVVLEQSDITAVKGQLFPFVKQKKPSDHHGLPGDEPICFVSPWDLLKY